MNLHSKTSTLTLHSLGNLSNEIKPARLKEFIAIGLAYGERLGVGP